MLLSTLLFGVIIAFFIGLLVRRKGDSTLDTWSKGCGWTIGLFVLFIIACVAYGFYLGNYDKFFN